MSKGQMTTLIEIIGQLLHMVKSYFCLATYLWGKSKIAMLMENLTSTVSVDKSTCKVNTAFGYFLTTYCEVLIFVCSACRLVLRRVLLAWVCIESGPTNLCWVEGRALLWCDTAPVPACARKIAILTDEIVPLKWTAVHTFGVRFSDVKSLLL